MKSMTNLVVICLATTLLITGCDQMSGGADSSTLVIDLAAVAKATGQEQAMQAKAQTSREEMNAQLVEHARNLEQQISQERAGMGDAPTQEQELQMQQMAQQAQQQYAQLQAEAQQNAQQYEMNLVLEFREQVQPFAEKVARARGASVILLADQTVFWLDPTIDLTGEIIDALRAEQVFSESNIDTDQAAEAPVIAD